MIFAELKDPVREKIERYELTRTINPDHFFPTIDAAVERYMHETDTTWRVPKDGSQRGTRLKLASRLIRPTITRAIESNNPAVRGRGLG